jgi:hypothetical protein
MAFTYNGSPIGPFYGPNRILVVQKDDDDTTYQLNIFADLFNEELRKDNKPLQFYYLPDAPRMAKNEKNDYMFQFTKFGGVLTSDSNIAVNGQTEVAGGVVAFTTTLKIPDKIIEKVKEEIRREIVSNAKFNNDKLFKLGENANQQIDLGVVPIVDNAVMVSNLTPQNISDPAAQQPENPWSWKMQGEGKGTINPVGNNAFTAMVGQYPAQIIAQAFRGASSPIFIHNTLKHKFYTGSFSATIKGEWKAIFNHFSANVKAKYLWAKADVQAAFNSAVKNGTITKSITIDNEVLTPEREKMYEAQVDKVFDKFMEAAQKTIFDVQPGKIENAKASDLMFAGISVALKVQHDEHHLSLDFTETINETYIKENTISSHLMGFYDVIKNNPEEEKKYFTTVHLDEGFRKIHVIASARAFWPNVNTRNADPIHSLKLEVGYPDSTGAIVYKNSGQFMQNLAATKSATLTPAIWNVDNKDMIVIFDFARQTNLPADKQNVIYVRRTIEFAINPSVEIPNQKWVVEEEQTLNHSIEIAASAPGRLMVGPIQLDTALDDRTVAMVTIKKVNRNPETFRFTNKNIEELQYFEAWTAKPEEALNWSYQVEMFLESKRPGLPSISYKGEEIPMQGSAPLIAKVPFPPDDLQDKIAKLKALNAQLIDDF